MNSLELDYQMYANKKQMPKYQLYFRKADLTKIILLRYYYLFLFNHYRKKCLCDFPRKVKIGGGLFINHPYCITINPEAVIGEKVCLHKGVTIGQENRGKRKGSPSIGNNVCICVNATIVGKIRIGNDVIIGPNAYVNRDIPDHSIVIGNPCIIKHRDNATEGYI